MTDEEIIAIAKSMERQPWGIGSRQPDAIAFARAVLRAQRGEPLSPYRWVEHKGYECPVPPNTMVHVRLRDGQESECPQPARKWIWEDGLNDSTISHYMVVR